MKTTIESRWSDALERYELKLDSEDLSAREISNWLDDDVTDGIESIDRWIGTFEAVAEGRRQSGCLGNGNAHRIFATRDKILVQCIFTNDGADVILITKDQVLNVLEKFKIFLKERSANPTTKPKSFEIEYEAEGRTAYEEYLRREGILDMVADNTREGYREKLGPHTFFPEHWTEEQAENEITASFKAGTMVNKWKWEGKGPSGVVFKGYIQTDEQKMEVVAAWPVYMR